jgi:hypothetical protein
VLTKPTVHLNGTSQRELAEQYANAYQALNDVLQVLALSHPNARDYYVQGPDAFPRAAHEHDDRMGRLIGVRDELLALYEAVEDQKRK